CAVAIEDTLFGLPSGSEMARQKLWLARQNIGELLFKDFGNLPVQSLPPAANQACIGDVLHERVLELIRGIGRDTPLEDQLCSYELRQRGVQIALRKPGDRGDQRI